MQRQQCSLRPAIGVPPSVPGAGDAIVAPGVSRIDLRRFDEVLFVATTYFVVILLAVLFIVAFPFYLLFAWMFGVA